MASVMTQQRGNTDPHGRLYTMFQKVKEIWEDLVSDAWLWQSEQMMFPWTTDGRIRITVCDTLIGPTLTNIRVEVKLSIRCVYARARIHWQVKMSRRRSGWNDACVHDLRPTAPRLRRVVRNVYRTVICYSACNTYLYRYFIIRLPIQHQLTQRQPCRSGSQQ